MSIKQQIVGAQVARPHRVPWQPAKHRKLPAVIRTSGYAQSDPLQGAIRILKGHEERLCSAVFSPDGERLVTAPTDTTARIWPVDPLRCAVKLKPRDLTETERNRFGLPSLKEQ